MRCLTIVLLACVALVSAQIPFRCKSPDAWEARSYEVATGRSYTRMGRIFYDALGQRVVFEEEIRSDGPETTAYNEYLFYKEKYMLRYDVNTKQCYRYPFNHTFSPIEVPSTAEFIDTHIIGTNAVEKFGVAVNIWGDNYGPNGRRLYEFVADDGDGDEDCLPVSYVEFGGVPGSIGFRRQSYFDIVIGVNPDHFIPPENCPR